MTVEIWFVFVLINQIFALSYNQPRFCPNATWNPNGTTLASQSIVGTNPLGIFVSSKNSIYVPSRQTGLIHIWENDCINPTKNISGSLSAPFSIFVTDNGDMYVDNGRDNHRVDKWIAETNTWTTVMFVRSLCHGLFVDICFNLYCSMRDDHQVVRRWLNDTTNMTTIVAGTGVEGSASNMLKKPHAIFVDVALNLYVADCNNHRIQLFRSGELNGRTVVGQGSSPPTIDLVYPTGIVLDGDQHLFIVDLGNHRIIESDGNFFQCIVACSNSFGQTFDKLHNPVSMSFDSHGNIYVTDFGNNRVQKFIRNNCSGESTIVSTTPHTSTEEMCHSIITTLPIATTEMEMTTTTTSISTHKITTTTSSIISTQREMTATVTELSSTPEEAVLTTSFIVTTQTEVAAITTINNETTVATVTMATTTPSYFLSNCSDQNKIGMNCDIPSNPCDILKPCQNNATCLNRTTDILGYICKCAPGFNGTQCQNDHRPCQSATCWNNGTCNRTSDTTFHCECQQGWTGIHCELIVDYCENITCENQGVCRRSFMNYTCDCVGENFSGQHCEKVATKLIVLKYVTRSVGYIAIIFLVCTIAFFVVMDILKYCFGIDLTKGELEQIRRAKAIAKAKQHRRPVIQRFKYVDAPRTTETTPTKNGKKSVKIADTTV